MHTKQELSKSNYILGISCPHALWIKIHEPERMPKVDEILQHRFDEGKLVGES